MYTTEIGTDAMQMLGSKNGGGNQTHKIEDLSGFFSSRYKPL